MGKVLTVCIWCVPTLHRMRVESRVFYPTISQRSCHVQHSTLGQNTAEQSVFNIQEFQTAFSTLHCTVRQRILNGKSGYSVHTVCSYIAQNARLITGLLSNNIAAILPCTALYVQSKCKHTLHVQHTRFQAASLPLYCTVSKFILHGKSGYSVHTVCSYIAQNVLCITSVLSNDIAAILPCKARYVQPKFSHTLHFQYTRVSSCFFTIILYCKQVYFTWEKCIQCAYDVFLHCTESALNNKCFIRRYRSDPAM